MRYTYRIIYVDTKKPFMVPSGHYEIPPEEVILDYNEAIEFVKNRPELTYELACDKVDLNPFNPELANVFVERPAHTMKVGDLFQNSDGYSGESWIDQVVEIGEIKNNVFKVLCSTFSSVKTFAVNQQILFLEEFEVHYELTYTKKVALFDLSKLNDVKVTKWSTSKEIHEHRIADARHLEATEMKESIYLMKKISEREIS